MPINRGWMGALGRLFVAIKLLAPLTTFIMPRIRHRPCDPMQTCLGDIVIEGIHEQGDGRPDQIMDSQAQERASAEHYPR